MQGFVDEEETGDVLCGECSIVRMLDADFGEEREG